MNNRQAYIYSLSHPLTGDVHYVGQTVALLPRFKSHLRNKGNINPHKKEWVDQLKKDNLLPLLNVVEVCDFKKRLNRERHYTILYKSLGWNIFSNFIVPVPISKKAKPRIFNVGFRNIIRRLYEGQDGVTATFKYPSELHSPIAHLVLDLTIRRYESIRKIDFVVYLIHKTVNILIHDTMKKTLASIPAQIIEELRSTDPITDDSKTWSGKIPIQTYNAIKRMQLSLREEYGGDFSMKRLFPYLLQQGVEHSNLLRKD